MKNDSPAVALILDPHTDSPPFFADLQNTLNRGQGSRLGCWRLRRFTKIIEPRDQVTIQDMLTVESGWVTVFSFLPYFYYLDLNWLLLLAMV